MKVKQDKYIIEFAVDGKHFQPAKTGYIEKMWNDFCFNPDYRTHIYINPFAIIQLRNLNTNQIIAELPNNIRR